MITDKKPIFVVGTPRAGTTLMSKIIGRHPDILAAGETHFFEDVYARKDTLGALDNAQQLAVASERLLTVFDRFNQEGQTLVDSALNSAELVDKALAFGGGYDGLYLAFTDCLAESANKSRYCDDTPKHLFYLETIFSFFPDASVIECVRDPRDFLCSYKNFWRRSRDPKRIKALYHPVVTSMLWRSSANTILHGPYADHPRVLRSHYETLVADPETVVRRICSFLEVDYDEDLLHIASNNSSFTKEETGIFGASIGQWHECLEPEELWCIQTLNKKNMATAGYTPVQPDYSRWKLLLLLLSTPVGVFRALRANRDRRGPLLKYILRRLNGL